jgi:tetratricopeptide (TPR) repeat protein
MPNIGDYLGLIELLLNETAKYFALLLFSVLAIRLWRRLPKLPGEKKPGNFALACLVSALAYGIGYFSICHSLGLMYSYFGMKAFRSHRLDPALSLFQTALNYWENADAVGGKGVCLIWTGKPDEGILLLDQARVLRKGKDSPFEDFYEGLYYFYHDDVTHAVPLLEAASADANYGWGITKLFAIIQLDRNQPQEARRLMQPFMKIEVMDPDQAYVIASLSLADGKKAEAQALVDKFSSGDLIPFWKVRFEKLRERIQKQNP